MTVTPRHIEKGGQSSALTKSNTYNKVTLPTLSLYGGKPVVWVSDRAQLRVGGVVVREGGR
jgi:hypothetical protein